MTAIDAPPPRISSAQAVPLERANYGDRAFRLVLTAAALLVPVLLGFLVYQLWTGAAPAMNRYGLDFMTTSTWDPVAEEFGAFPLIFGTLIRSMI